MIEKLRYPERGSPDHRHVVFVSGTRADFGKIKSLIHSLEEEDGFEVSVFVTGMHTLSRYGYTAYEVLRENFSNPHVFFNQISGEPLESVVASTITGLSRYVHEIKPDMLIVHGDRVEALAGAIVGSLTNTLVMHIEGGELSGTIDDLLRHAVTKLAHIHLVANDKAARRVQQLGEHPDTIFTIGSPDLDLMVKGNLAEMSEVRERYSVPETPFAIGIFHPVTTELDQLEEYSEAFVDALLEDDHRYLMIYPNNDPGNEIILNGYRRLKDHPRFQVVRSMRFEAFLTALKHARFVIGNSSAGIREAPFYAVPSVNVGSRQSNRSQWVSIVNTGNGKDDILAGIQKALTLDLLPPSTEFGDGNSTERFIEVIRSPEVWSVERQKRFYDMPLADPELIKSLSKKVDAT